MQKNIFFFLSILLTFLCINIVTAEAAEKSASDLILAGANCLDSQANWVDREKGREIYNTLRNMQSQTVVDSLGKAVIAGKDRLRILFLAVKLGINGTEEKLNGILSNHGDKAMAEDFLNSGSNKLFEGGKSWANSNGYSINTGMGSHRVGWGKF